MSKKEKKMVVLVSGVIALVLMAIFGIKMISMGFAVPDCKAMEPLPPETDTLNKHLDFSDKTVIGWHKYGFRKKFVVKETAVLLMEAGGSSDSAYFGVYQDENLKNPVEEVPFTWEGRNGLWEEGRGKYIPNDESKDGIVILQPGTYYTAVWTKKVFDDSEVSYLSYICPLNENCRLKEGEKVEFCSVKKGQTNTFEIRGKRKGRIQITADVYLRGTIKIYDNTRKLLFQQKVQDYSKRTLTKPVLDVEAGKMYSVEISQMEPLKNHHLINLFTIRYEYV